jgi:hypothetical protein
MTDRERAIHVWASDLARRLPDGVRADQAAEYVRVLDEECGGVDHLNLVGAALRALRGALSVANVRAVAREIRDPQSRTPTEASARDCQRCQGSGWATSWYLRTTDHGRRPRLEILDECDPHPLRTPVLAGRVDGKVQQVVTAAHACQCDYGQHLKRLRAARENE